MDNSTTAPIILMDNLVAYWPFVVFNNYEKNEMKELTADH